MKKVEPIRVRIRQSENAVLLRPVETLAIYFAYDRKKLIVTLTAQPDRSEKEGGVDGYFLDCYNAPQQTISSSPHGITPKRAREILVETRQAIADRFGDAWDFVLDVCRKKGWEPIDPAIEITEDEWALLDDPALL